FRALRCFSAPPLRSGPFFAGREFELRLAREHRCFFAEGQVAPRRFGEVEQVAEFFGARFWGFADRAADDVQFTGLSARHARLALHRDRRELRPFFGDKFQFHRRSRFKRRHYSGRFDRFFHRAFRVTRYGTFEEFERFGAVFVRAFDERDFYFHFAFNRQAIGSFQDERFDDGDVFLDRFFYAHAQRGSFHLPFDRGSRGSCDSGERKRHDQRYSNGLLAHDSPFHR